MSELIVTHDPQRHRYEARVGGALAGTAEYRLTDEIITFTHTRVDAAYEGRGVGGALARFALHDVRAEGNRRVVPQCGFIKGWIDKHPEYAALLAKEPGVSA